MSTRPGLLISSSLFFILPTNVAGFPSRRRCFLPFPDTPLLSGCLLSGMLCCCIFNGGICNWIVIEFSWKRICQLYIYIYRAILRVRNWWNLSRNGGSKIERLRWILFEIRDWIRGIEYLLSFPFPRKIGFPNVLIGVFLFSWPQFHDSQSPSPPGGVGERESPLPGRSYRRSKLQASACSCEKGLETAGGVKTTPAFEAEVWKIRYPSSLSHGLLDYGMAL